MRSLSIPLLALTLLACPPYQAPDPPPDTDWCGRMCGHLKKFGCEEGEPVYNSDLPGEPEVPNQSCQEFCEELQGKGFAVNPRCVASVETCEQIEDFRQRDPATCRSK